MPDILGNRPSKWFVLAAQDPLAGLDVHVRKPLVVEAPDLILDELYDVTRMGKITTAPLDLILCVIGEYCNKEFAEVLWGHRRRILRLCFEPLSDVRIEVAQVLALGPGME